MDKSLDRQMQRDFCKTLHRQGIEITVKYETPPDGAIDGIYEIGVPWQKTVKALFEKVNNLNIKKYQFADVISGKIIFFVDYQEFDFDGKNNIEVIWNHKTYHIADAIPDVPLHNEQYLYYMLIQG